MFALLALCLLWLRIHQEWHKIWDGISGSTQQCGRWNTRSSCRWASCTAGRASRRRRRCTTTRRGGPPSTSSSTWSASASDWRASESTRQDSATKVSILLSTSLSPSSSIKTPHPPPHIHPDPDGEIFCETAQAAPSGVESLLSYTNWSLALLTTTFIFVIPNVLKLLLSFLISSSSTCLSSFQFLSFPFSSSHHQCLTLPTNHFILVSDVLILLLILLIEFFSSFVFKSSSEL